MWCKLRRSTIILQFLGKKRRFLTNHSNYYLKIWQSSLEAMDLNHPQQSCYHVTAQHNQNRCFHTNINRINILVYQPLHTVPYTTKSSHPWDEAQQLLSNALQYYTAIWDLGSRLLLILRGEFWPATPDSFQTVKLLTHLQLPFDAHEQTEPRLNLSFNVPGSWIRLSYWIHVKSTAFWFSDPTAKSRTFFQDRQAKPLLTSTNLV